MSQLAGADAKKLLAFVGDAHAVDGPEPFTTELLDRLIDVMQCEFATYYRLDVAHCVAYGYVPCSHEAQYAAVARSEWSIDARSADRVRPHQVQTWSDIYARDVRRRFEVTSWASAFGVVDCAWTLFGAGPFEECALLLHRQERDFTERDRESLIALRPHVHALIRGARARRRFADLLAAIDAGDEDEPHGLLLLGTGLEIEHASRGARRIVEHWFGGLDGRLPTQLEEWLVARSAGDSLYVEREGLRLVVEAPTIGALVLTEEAVPPDSLTPREMEVLRCLAAGKSTSEIARMLWVTRATVSKHLEHIYRKLGVTSRTAALAAVGARAGWLEPSDR